MRRLLQTVAILLTCGALLCPQMEARGRNNSDNSRQTEQRKQNTPQRPAHNNGSNRPGQQPSQNNNGSRPSQRPNQNNGSNRPAQRPGQNNGSNRPAQRPGQSGIGSNTHQRPKHNQITNRPPASDKNHNFNHGTPPPRPHMPAHRPWHRPTPPPSFRPAPGWRPFRSILGVALGSAINFSVNALVNAGYAISGYGSNAIYVTDAPMLGLMWPDATLYYGNGGLYASEFVYSTPGYSMSRYNSAYNSLIGTYGYPIEVSNTNGSIVSTWWGSDNQFIRLSFQSGIAGNGRLRYFTTLSFGN